MTDRHDHDGDAVATRLAHGGRNPRAQHGFVNPPVYHGSTVTFPNVDTMLKGAQTYTYGRRGSPTIDALTSLLAELDGAAGAVLVPSGLSAISTAILAVVGAGDHLLVTDAIYQPGRHFCDTVLKRFGVETTYYDPRIGAEIEALVRPNTRAIHIEAPGSITFDMSDLPAITTVARKHGIKTIADNTWATPLFFRPLDHGVDIALMAGTKYVVGHSDVLIGTIAANEETWPALRQLHGTLGLCVGPDDINLSLRGLRTMKVRLDRHQASALEIANWLAGRPEVARVLYPGHPSDPGYPLWKRDFKGASGLLGFVTRPVPVAAVKAMLDGLRLFGLGYSWGGFESLAILSNPKPYRTATSWDDPGHVVRLHIGLEEPADLIADLEAGFERLNAAA